MQKKWDILISIFRRLGGIAENVCQREGGFGRGIFSVDPSLSSRIYTPSELMIEKDDFYLDNNKIRIKKEKNYSNEVRDFCNYYQDNFSWGGGGNETTQAFEKGLNLFPNDLKKLIKDYTLLDIEKSQQGDWDEIILRRFLDQRKFKFNNNSVICPVLELVNHQVNAFPFVRIGNGLSTPNYPPQSSELFFAYGYKSSLRRVFSYGFFCKESVVFSFPFSIYFEDQDIQFICKGLELNTDKIQYQFTNSQIIVDGLPVGSIYRPSFIKSYFDHLLDLTDFKTIPKDVLLKILDFNLVRRKEILSKLLLVDNYSSRMICKAINYEVELISQV